MGMSVKNAIAMMCLFYLECSILAFTTAFTSSSTAFIVPSRPLPAPSSQHHALNSRSHQPLFRTKTKLSMLSSTSSSPPIPTWEQLQSNPFIQTSLHTPRPIYKNELPHEVAAANAQRQPHPLPVLYRDANCICAASQTVWMGLECKNVEYLTVLVDKKFSLGRPPPEDDTTKELTENGDVIPRIEWNDQNNESPTTTSDPIKLLEQIQSHYPETPPNFYPKLSSAVDASRCNIMRFAGVMPRNSDPQYMSHAPLLFRPDGTKVPKSSHCVSLEEVEEMMEEYYTGPYLCGKDVTAADWAWIPYLERYAVQLPYVFPRVEVLNPRSKEYYEMVDEWLLALERSTPMYACGIMGDARVWRTCLEEVVELHNARAASEEEKVALGPVPKRNGWWMKKNPKGEELWSSYVEGRPWLGDTPKREAGLYFLRNKGEIMEDVSLLSAEEADAALREVIHVLIDGELNDGVELSENARQLVELVGERISVPKDLGMVPALALWSLIQ